MKLTPRQIETLTSRRIGDIVTYPDTDRPARILSMHLDGDGALTYTIETDLSATQPTWRLGRTANVTASYYGD